MNDYTRRRGMVKVSFSGQFGIDVARLFEGLIKPIQLINACSSCSLNTRSDYTMRLPRGFVDDVKNQADILRVVSDYVTLKKRGANYLACCPFHSEKTPSFNVHPGKGIFKCFGCNVGGGLFDFVMRIEGCDFLESVRIVAQKCGIPIPAAEESEDYKRVAKDRESILRLNEWAADFFESQLNDNQVGAAARDYIAFRGIENRPHITSPR